MRSAWVIPAEMIMTADAGQRTSSGRHKADNGILARVEHFNRPALVTAAVAGLLVSSVLPAMADKPTPPPALTAIKGFKEAVKTTTDGTKLRNKARIVGGAPRVVEIQYSSDGSTWVTVRTRTTDTRGRLRFVVQVAPDRNRWRLNVPATTTHAGLTSAVKSYAVQVADEDQCVQNMPYPAVSATQVTASKAYARSYILATYGWGDEEFLALEQLWTRESGWNHLAMNPTSCAHGIPQSLPGNKMAEAGPDWRTNPETQIRWGASYIKVRYGTPAKAWKEFQRKGWY